MNPSTSSTITIDEKTEDLEIDTDEKHDNECVLLLNSEVQKFKNVKEKRQDLQGIRGLAILSVIGFHFLPSSFPNGYLGVDQ
uniref:Acyl_transf_3 domain-containing protein n=1 Tax=Caenorhabditis tropicalis TaxID=1561998 RepID=A0A1I7V041_9PELO